MKKEKLLHYVFVLTLILAAYFMGKRHVYHEAVNHNVAIFDGHGNFTWK